MWLYSTQDGVSINYVLDLIYWLLTFLSFMFIVNIIECDSNECKGERLRIRNLLGGISLSISEEKNQ